MNPKITWLLWLTLSIASIAPAHPLTICFTPGGDCTGIIVQQIQQTKSTIHMQAYSFTSRPIAQALVQAAKKGVKVNVIVDKTNESSNSSSVAPWLSKQGIPVWVDYRPSIAHNKIIIIDKQTVITGSFNFTRAAQSANTENIIVIHDSAIAEQYLANWQRRQSVSRPLHAKHEEVTRDTELLRWLKKELYRLLNRLLKQAI